MLNYNPDNRISDSVFLAMPLLTLRDFCSHEEEIRKSRFLARAAPVASLKAAAAFLHCVARTPASHHAWAYRIGDEYRFNDAGEPTGTAGKPILQAIAGQQCDRIMVVVTRWFGGIELGTGGLVRAYGGCAAACLRNAILVPLIDMVAARCACGFSELPLIKARLLEQDVSIEKESFDGQGAVLDLSIPADRLDDVSAMLSNISRGRTVLVIRN
jgi:uncharacterized YigZ family protein